MVRLWNAHAALSGSLEDSMAPEFLAEAPSSTKFTREQALVDTFAQHSRAAVTSGYGLEFEVDSGNGIADIVFYKKRKDWRKYDSLAALSPQWVACLAALPYRKVFSVGFFAQLCCVTDRTAERALREFAAHGYCEKRQSGWVKWRQPVSPFTQLCAIEAKLRDWKRALYQATRYTDFADQSWVLLDHHFSGPAIKNIEHFSRRNVGLLTLDSTGRVHEAWRPTTKEPRSEFRRWYAAIETLRLANQPR